MGGADSSDVQAGVSTHLCARPHVVWDGTGDGSEGRWAVSQEPHPGKEL